jgi:glycosyltransferase involved in cell wall biosynthesis
VKAVLFANTDWYLYNFRRALAVALRDRGYDVVLVSPNGPYAPRFAEMGLRWIEAPMERRSLNPVREVGLLLWLLRLLRRERPDVVHGFTIKCAVYGALAARLAGISARISAVAGMGYVFTSSDLTARALRPVVALLLRVALGGSSARLILQNADDVAHFEGARLVDPAHIRLIPGSGVDCGTFSPRGSRGARERVRVLLASRLLWDKGVAEFVDASLQLRPDRRFEFLLAGDPDPGNPAAVPASAVRDWERAGLLTWLGHVDDMPALLRDVDVVVLPSYREGVPRGLIEAAACALPIVTTDVPGCRDVVIHEQTGLLVPARNAGALAAAIRRLGDDAELGVRLGAAARERALERFDERIIIDRTLAVYGELGRLPAPSHHRADAAGIRGSLE